MTLSQKLDLALIGNCRVAALVDRQARLVWWCFPRFDSNPVFSRLLAGNEEKGFCDVVLDSMVDSDASYLRNTPIVTTTMRDARGSEVRITDFVPRFFRYERIFRPPQLIRRIEPVAGLPRITIRVRPTFGYGRAFSQMAVGSNHIRYVGCDDVLRVTTDAPLSYIAEETMFALTRPVTLIMGADEPYTTGIDATSREFQDRTRDYWQIWVRGLAIPFEWQSAVIRAAITLRLCSFEETGGIIAAHTTSIPEAAGSGRNWDYRYCWLRDAYFVIHALNHLGATQTMEAYINYIMTIVVDSEHPLQPVYSIVPNLRLDENIAPDLAGFQGHGPVRIGNQAAGQIQHDIYGTVVLGASQMFVDERLPHIGDESLFHHLEALGERAARFAMTPDAGLWEYRGRQRIHTYSAALCFAASDRLAQIAVKIGLTERAEFWRQRAKSMRSEILSRAWNEKIGAFVGAFDHTELDASVLQIAEIGLIDPAEPRFVRTCDAIGRELTRNGWIMRYTAEDDFGAPETAFLVCSFWYVDALVSIGRRDEARALFVNILERRNSFGILSEDIHPINGELWGNFPQTYSMAGIINSARRLSLPWEEAWRRVSS
jgi:GH15 family glucan-1,4-alpha-glucosidase